MKLPGCVPAFPVQRDVTVALLALVFYSHNDAITEQTVGTVAMKRSVRTCHSAPSAVAMVGV